MMGQLYMEMGYKNIYFNPITVQFMGEERSGALITATVENTQMFQKIVQMMNGEYLVTVTATCFRYDATDSVLDLIQKL